MTSDTSAATENTGGDNQWPSTGRALKGEEMNWRCRPSLQAVGAPGREDDLIKAGAPLGHGHPTIGPPLEAGWRGLEVSSLTPAFDSSKFFFLNFTKHVHKRVGKKQETIERKSVGYSFCSTSGG